MKRRAAALIVCVLLAGCGGSSGPIQPNGGGTTNGPGTPAAPAMAANSLGLWTIKPLSSTEDKTASGCGSWPIPEGFVRRALVFQIHNETTSLLTRWETITATASSDAGFVYGCGGGASAGGLDWPNVAVIPPGFGIPMSLAVDVPTSATGLVITLKIKANDFGCPGSTACTLDIPIASFASTAVEAQTDIPTSGLKKLGDTITQGPLSVTPSSVRLDAPCARGDLNDAHWTVDVAMTATNSYGYGLWNLGTLVEVLDEHGNVWGGNRSGFDGVIGSGDGPSVGQMVQDGAYVPPNGSKPLVASVGISKIDALHPCDGPAASSGRMYFLVSMPALLNGQQPFADATWAVYDLGVPAKQ